MCKYHEGQSQLEGSAILTLSSDHTTLEGGPLHSNWDGGQSQRDLDHLAEQLWLRKVSCGLLSLLLY